MFFENSPDIKNIGRNNIISLLVQNTHIRTVFDYNVLGIEIIFFEDCEHCFSDFGLSYVSALFFSCPGDLFKHVAIVFS